MGKLNRFAVYRAIANLYDASGKKCSGQSSVIACHKKKHQLGSHLEF
jgi:hypothetical protein